MTEASPPARTSRRPSTSAATGNTVGRAAGAWFLYPGQMRVTDMVGSILTAPAGTGSPASSMPGTSKTGDPPGPSIWEA